MSATAALEAEIRRVLSASAEVQAKFGAPARLVEGETARAAFPFIRLARHEIRPEEPGAGGPIEHRVSLEIYSRAGGRDEANTLIALVSNILRSASLSPEGHRVILFFPVFSDVFLRRDGSTYRGLLRMKALSEAVTGEE